MATILPRPHSCWLVVINRQTQGIMLTFVYAWIHPLERPALGWRGNHLYQLSFPGSVGICSVKKRSPVGDFLVGLQLAPFSRWETNPQIQVGRVPLMYLVYCFLIVHDCWSEITDSMRLISPQDPPTVNLKKQRIVQYPRQR